MARRFAFLAVAFAMTLVARTGFAGPPEAAAKPAAQPAARALQPWERAPFEAGPEEILAATAALGPAPKDAGVDVLLRRVEITFDVQGRATRRSLLVSRILTAEGARGWATTEAPWVPWRQNRPSLRARVIRPDGRVFTLDPTTIAEVTRERAESFGDTRALTAPLPAVDVGSYIEEESVETDTEPAFEEGVVDFLGLRFAAAARSTQLRLQAPTSLPLAWRMRGSALEPAVRESNGLRTVELNAGPQPRSEGFEAYLPSEVPRAPTLAYSTGASWSRIARAYAAIVDRAVASGAAPAADPAPSGARETRVELATRLLTGIWREIRYTSVALGRSAFEPRSPAQTLERKYGDCKDLATLLVARLRAAGVAAHVALLRTGPGEDIAPELPGMGMFNHAIVYVPGSPALWIDPTARNHLPGSLPLSDEARLALVADASTKALVTTPRSPASANVFLQSFRYELGEVGPARGSVEIEARGSFANDIRGHLEKGESAFRKSWEDHLKQYHAAAGATVKEHSELASLDQPFRLKAELDEVRRSHTDERSIEVMLAWKGVLGDIPGLLTTDPNDKESKDDDRDDEDADAEGPGPRVGPVQLWLLHTVETRYTVAPPPGYVPRELPPNDEQVFGPVRITRRVQANPDDTVSAVFRLETGDGRIGADQLAAIQRDLAAFKKKDWVKIQFDNKAALLRAAGRIREAIEEHRRVAALHPTEGLHPRRLSDMLLEIGMGDAAVREARRAVELDPKSTWSHHQLGWALQHDALGRRFETGYPRAEAIAEMRAAVELAPKNAGIRADLAVSYEHGTDGVRFWGEGSQLEEAIREYRVTVDEIKDERFRDDLLVALVRAGLWEEARQRAEKLPAGELRDDVLVTAAAALAPDAGAAIKEAARLVPDPRRMREALLKASSRLTAARRYPLAAALLREGVRGSELTSGRQVKLEIVERARPRNPGEPFSRDPIEFVRQFQVEVLTPSVRDADLRRFAATALLSRNGELDVKGELGIDERMLRSYFKQIATSLPAPVSADLAMGVLDCKVAEHGTAAVRLRCTSPYQVGLPETWYLVRERGELRILATEKSLALLGEEALRLLDAGDLAAARGWLDWARETARPVMTEDFDSLGVFPLLWNNGEQSPDGAARAAALALSAHSPRREKYVEPLRKLQQATVDAVLRARLERAVAVALVDRSRDTELAGVLAPMIAAHAGTSRLFRIYAFALIFSGKLDQIRQEARQRLAAAPGDETVREILSNVYIRQNDLEALDKLHRDAIASGNAIAMDYNQLAWSELFRREVSAEPVEFARKAVALSNERRRGYLHTLASCYAVAGQSQEAMQTLWKSLDVGDGVPTSDDWFVVGRVAEAYGLRDDAVAAYRRVKPSSHPDPLDTLELARARLQALEKPEAAR